MPVDVATGLPVALGAVLAEGGEGRLCATDRPGLVAKLYHRPVPERAVKLAALLLHPARSVAGVVWPASALRDEAGRTIGFLMPWIEGAQPLTVLANARLRLAQAPGFTWYHLHVTARRLADLVGRLHAAEIVVGDLKPENLLVDAKARLTLIDADSVQFTLAGKMHRCAVGAEGFVAPELVGQDLAAIDRDQSHDRFALGVLIHTLLLGHHPFAGVWLGGGQGPGQGAGDPPTLDGLVRAGHYPGLAVSPQRPGPFAVTPNALHPALRGLVRRCFVDGHRQPAARPAPVEWVAALDAALEDLVLCAEEPGHFRAASSGPCPWCARRADLGIDSFADSEGARELMADGLRKALEAGDLMRQAFLWSHHPLLWQHADFAGEAARLGRMAAALPAVERLKSVLARTPDDAEALVAVWRRMPDLGDNPLANPLVGALTLPDGRPVAQAVAEAEGRLDRLRQLRASFAAGPPTPESAPGLVAAYRLAADAFGADSRFLRPYARRAEAAASLLAETAFSGKA